jgi:uncharacterized protein YfkK (UPF0435 family)
LLSENDVIDIIAEVTATSSNGERGNITFLAQFPTSRVPVTSQTDNVVEVTSIEGEATPAAEGEATSAAEGEATPAAEGEATLAAEGEATPAAEEPVDTAVATNEWINVSVEAVDGDDADRKAELNVMAKRIAIAEAIAEKTVQLEKAVAEIAEIQKRLKEAQASMVKEQKSAAVSKASAAAKKKATVAASKRKSTGSKTAKKGVKNNSAADEEDDDDITDKQQVMEKKSRFGVPSLGEVQAFAINGGYMALNLTLANRAFVFFGLAAAGIYAYGDYASV